MPAKNTRTPKTTTTVTWAEPPPRRMGGGGSPARYLELADALRANPGEWAVFNTYATANRAYSAANHVRKGGVKGLPEGEFEAVGRGVEGTGEGVVYVRYIGKPKAAAKPRAKAKTTRTTRARKAKS